MTMYRRHHHTAIAALAAGTLVLAACGVDSDGAAAPSTTAAAVASTTVPVTPEPILVELPAAIDAWVRMPVTGQTVAAAYVTFVNDSDHDVDLLGVSSPLATAELHETVADDDGVMRMQPRPGGFVVPAGGELAMAPGGAHVMLVDVDVLDLATATEVELVFDFGPAGELAVGAEIRGDLNEPADVAGDDDHASGHGDDGEHAGHGDHGDHEDHADHEDHGDVELGEPDPNVLHDLDDELHAGVLDPDAQRATVAEFRAALLQSDLLAASEGFDLDQFLGVLDELDAALEAGDRETAAALAFRAHDLAHALYPHSH